MLGASGSPSAQGEEVVRAARFGAGADGGALPAAEWLASHDGSGGAAVDVEVAGVDLVEPGRDLVGVEGMDAGGQAVVDVVDDVDGVGERVGGHDPEDGAEVLGAVEG